MFSNVTINKTEQAKPSSLDALTGLRFVAAMAVVVVHGLRFTQGHTETGPWAANSVAFFFVLSGFILTYVYEERLKKIGILKFYVARFARIWPLHIFCLLAMLWVQGFLFGDRPLAFDLKLIANVVLIQSWFLSETLPMQFNGLAWSISTELGFYLLFPLILLLGRKRFLPVLIANIVFLSIAMLALDSLRENGAIDMMVAKVFVYVNPLIRLLDFVAGMFTAKLFLKFRPGTQSNSKSSDEPPLLHTVAELSAIGFVIATVFLVNFGSLSEFMRDQHLVTTYAWLSRGGACLIPFCLTIWVFTWSQGWFAKLLSTRLMVYLGEISFALYLIQLPVFFLLNQQVFNLNWPASLYLAVSVAGSIASAMLAHAMIEEPFRQFFISLFANNRSKLYQSLTLGFKNLHTRQTGLTAALILLLCYGAVRFERTHGEIRVPTSELLGVANELVDVKFAPITFEREATLHWLKVDDRGDHVELTMWWELLKGHQRARIMHFSDSKEKLLQAGHRNNVDFLSKPAGSIVLETCTINKAELPPDTRYIGVGFWLEGLGGVAANQGQTQMSQRRLLVAEITANGVVGIDEAKARPSTANITASVDQSTPLTTNITASVDLSPPLTATKRL